MENPSKLQPKTSEEYLHMNSFPYTLIRSDRKSIGIRITADGVVVRAPKRLPAAEIDRFVQSKRNWIETHLAKIPAPQPKFTHAEIEPLLFVCLKASQ